MFAKKVVGFLLAVIVIAAISLSPAAEEAAMMTKLLVTPPKVRVKDSKLSPSLHSLVSSDSILVGQMAKGQILIQVRKDAAARVKDELTKSGAKVANAGIAAKGRTIPLRALLVKYTAKDKEQARKALDKQGFTIVEDYKPGSFFRVRPSKDRIHTSSISTLSKLPSVAHVQLERILSVPTPRPKKAVKFKSDTGNTPNDEFFGELWGMRAINASKAWANSTKSTKLVAVIDTGIDYQHDDLNTNMWKNPMRDPAKQDVYGYDHVHDNGDPSDDNDHGTHCAGTIAAVGNNRIGVAGVCWTGNLMAVKFLDSTGNGSNTNAIKCIDYAINKGARIISASWGGDNDDQLLYDAIARAKAKDVLFVVAAGNDSNNNDKKEEREYPCSYGSQVFTDDRPALDNIIAVMAVDQKDKTPEWSGYGQKSIHIAAPGVEILSCQPANHYQKLDGTSMATPHVAGAAALVWSQPSYAALKCTAIRKLLMDKARRVPGLKCQSGVLDLSFLAKKESKD